MVAHSQTGGSGLETAITSIGSPEFTVNQSSVSRACELKAPRVRGAHLMSDQNIAKTTDEPTNPHSMTSREGAGRDVWRGGSSPLFEFAWHARKNMAADLSQAYLWTELHIYLRR